MRLIGGPQHVQSSLKTAGVTDISIDRYELQIQPEILGLPAYVPGHHVDENEFERKIASANPKEKLAALQRYLTDRRDSATPRGAMHFLNCCIQASCFQRNRRSS